MSPDIDSRHCAVRFLASGCIVSHLLWPTTAPRTFKQFKDSTIGLSYSSNAVPDAETIHALLAEVKSDVEVRTVDHRYSFGTHDNAKRRLAAEYLFIGR